MGWRNGWGRRSQRESERRCVDSSPLVEERVPPGGPVRHRLLVDPLRGVTYLFSLEDVTGSRASPTARPLASELS